MATVLVYSDDRNTRADVRFALGSRVSGSDEELAIVEAATQPAVLTLLDRGDIDLCVLDGEAVLTAVLVDGQPIREFVKAQRAGK